MWTSALFNAKNIGFFEIYGMSARAREVEPVQTFFGQGGGVNFSRFCADVLYGRPLTKINLVILIIIICNLVFKNTLFPKTVHTVEIMIEIFQHSLRSALFIGNCFFFYIMCDDVTQIGVPIYLYAPNNSLIILVMRKIG